MWDDDDNKIFEHVGKVTPELSELYRQHWGTKFLRDDIQRFRTAALTLKSTEWTEEARQYVESIADNALPAIKSLDDQLKILDLKIKALEAAL